ncbi:MAG: hypothetical protein QOG45_2381 [Chloroflexota bacterium]|nr:hypothetical protein [Chloroflexota bacterium]
MKRRISLVVGSAAVAGATAAFAIGGTHAFAETAMSASASGPVSMQLDVAGLPAVGLPTVDAASLFASAQQLAQSLGLPIPPLPVTLPGLPDTSSLLSDPTGFVTGMVSNPMGILNLVSISSILAPVQGLTGGIGDPGAVLSMLPDPNALLGTVPGAAVLQSLLGNTALSSVMGTVTGAISDPMSLMSLITGGPLGSVTGILGSPTSILSTVTGSPTGVLSGLAGGGNPLGIASGLLGTVAGVDPTGLLGGLLSGAGGNPLSTVTGLVSNPTGAATGVLGTVAGLDPTGTLPGVVHTVTSTLGGLTGGLASAQTTTGGPKASINLNVPAVPQLSLPALPMVPAVGGLTSTVTGTLNGVTGTVNGLLGSLTSSLPVSIPSVSGLTGNVTKSLPVSANVCLPVVGCL